MQPDHALDYQLVEALLDQRLRFPYFINSENQAHLHAQKRLNQRLLQLQPEIDSVPLPSRTKRNYGQKAFGENRHLHPGADYPNHPNQNRNEKAQRTELSGKKKDNALTFRTLKEKLSGFRSADSKMKLLRVRGETNDTFLHSKPCSAKPRRNVIFRFSACLAVDLKSF